MNFVQLAWTHLLGSLPFQCVLIVLACLAIGWKSKKDSLKIVGLVLFVVTASSALVAFLLNDTPGTLAVTYPYVNPSALKFLAQRAQKTMWPLGAIILLALVDLGYYFAKKKLIKGSRLLLLLLGVASFGMMLWTLRLDLRIRHIEKKQDEKNVHNPKKNYETDPE